MVEGDEALERFQQALKAVLKVPKSALPPSPFARGATMPPQKKESSSP